MAAGSWCSRPRLLLCWRARESERKQVDLSYSLGLTMNESGTVEDVAIDGPAQKAGMAPAVQVIAVNGRQYNSTVLREAVSKSTQTTEPLDLLIKDGDYYRTVHLDYHGGERYPQLERDESKPDVLSLIIAAKAKK